ncbi:hypothetical protein CBM2609_A140352 [Cupriavidus taiwanensis]|nr:hypothetical protein CBM2609_A140352 [Cupriavidus taiwanensis]SOZ44875.1 hypothetical protein CBM2610_A150349 [Cupriavidus taiwanensis]SPA45630.1 hypothetical protein CBM2629_A240103 [Cupriavidus taiwanensis]
MDNEKWELMAPIFLLKVAAIGHEASFASTDAWTLVRPLRSSNRPLFAIASVAFVALRHAFVS